MKEVLSITQLLDKFCNNGGDFSLKELRRLHHLLCDEAMTEEISFWMHQRWVQDPDDFAEVNFEAIYSKVEEQIHLQRPSKRRLLVSLQRVAAILILSLVGLSGLFLIQTIKEKQAVSVYSSAVVPFEQEYITPPGMRSLVILPDSSVVWLNASSHLKVHAGYGADSRNVELIGEAYFKVAQYRGTTFVVSTSDMDVKALGTAFNVSAYPESTTQQAVLVEGKVEVAMKGGKKLDLKPDQLVELNKEEGIIDIQTNISSALYTAWTNGVLIFQKMPIEEVTNTLERWFNVTIELRDSVLREYRYTGTFDNRSLEQILHYISLSSNIGYKMDKDSIILFDRRN